MATAQSVMTMPMWRLRLEALRLQILIATSKRWRHRGPGIRGAFSAAWRNIAQGITMPIMSFWSCNFGVLFSIWAFLRIIDEYVDGALNLPEGVTIEHYLARKRNLINAYREGRLPGLEIAREDRLLLFALRECSRRGVDIIPDLLTQLYWFSFDAKRRGSGKATTKAILDHCAFDLEFTIVRFAAQILGGDMPLVEKICKALNGLLQELDWLKDVIEDLEQGYINISSEAGIDLRKLSCARTWEELWAVPGFTAWHKEEVLRIASEWWKVKNLLKPALRRIIPQYWARVLFHCWLNEQRKKLDELILLHI